MFRYWRFETQAKKKLSLIKLQTGLSALNGMWGIQCLTFNIPFHTVSPRVAAKDAAFWKLLARFRHQCIYILIEQPARSSVLRLEFIQLQHAIALEIHQIILARARHLRLTSRSICSDHESTACLLMLIQLGTRRVAQHPLEFETVNCYGVTIRRSAKHPPIGTGQAAGKATVMGPLEGVPTRLNLVLSTIYLLSCLFLSRLYTEIRLG